MSRPEKTHPLYHWRQERKISLHALAGQVEASQPHLSEIENWNNKPSLELAAQLSRVTGLPMESFVRPDSESAA